ncbi:hypothetical protein LZ30DRAFT_470883 [Colletotrichum cereale]|nr:hypothetical protein LZ30DRAFT_470883 [Colletotrichum cereale]
MVSLLPSPSLTQVHDPRLLSFSSVLYILREIGTFSFCISILPKENKQSEKPFRGNCTSRASCFGSSSAVLALTESIASTPPTPTSDHLVPIALSLFSLPPVVRAAPLTLSFAHTHPRRRRRRRRRDRSLHLSSWTGLVWSCCSSPAFPTEQPAAAQHKTRKSSSPQTHLHLSSHPKPLSPPRGHT